MVYRLSSMKNRTKIVFFLLIWIFSAISAVLGSIFISTAVILPQTPYKVQENPLIENIRKEMGQWLEFGYYEPEEKTFYSNIILIFEQQRLVAINPATNKPIPNFKIWHLEEVRENGTIFFIPDTGVLAFMLFNGTSYEVDIKLPEYIWIDFNARRLIIRYQPGEDFPIVQRYYDDVQQREVITNMGSYFVVKNRPFGDWISTIISTVWTNFFDQFMFVTRTLLQTVAIGGGAGILTAFILILTRIASFFGGKRWTYLILRGLNGKLGWLLSWIPLFDFGGEFYVEERFVNIIDLSSVRSTLKELYKQRWYDTLFFPAALAAILTIVFVQNFPGEDKLLALVLSPLLSPIVLILLLIYFPMIWSFNEGGFKRMEISPQGDIIAVKPLGKILRDGIGIIVGFSGIISLGALAVEITQSVASQPVSTGEIHVAGFTLDLFGILLLIFWTLGLFLILLGSIIVGASLLAVNYLQASHLRNIENLRTKSEKESLITNWGSVTYQFTPKAKETIYMKDNEKN
ncbi:MAG: hypothetical protein ACTSW1_11430 [Candidatus Hodarchaeales archaeon]